MTAATTQQRSEPSEEIGHRPQETRPHILLVNAFEKIPGEDFRDQRYTFLYEMLKRRGPVTWFSSNFHHWSRRRRTREMLPPEDRPNIRLIRTLSYRRNVSLRRFVSYLGLSLATFWSLLRLDKRPDVIVCMGAPEQMFLVTLYGRWCRVPVVIDVIDTWPDLYVQAFPRSLRWLGRILLTPYFLMSRMTFAWSTRVTAVSRTYLDWAKRRGRRTDSESFRLFYLGARNECFDVEAIQPPGASLACLFAGQFGFSYDVELILDAAEKLQSEGRTDIRFVLCGAGDKQTMVGQRAKSLRNVELKGWMTPAQLNALAEECAVGLCCYTTLATQSIPTKIFDYLSMGLHVVSSLEGEAADLLATHEIGSTYRAGDFASFIACLERVRSEVDLGKQGRTRIRRTFEQQFDSPVIYRQMIEDVLLPLARRDLTPPA